MAQIPKETIEKVLDSTDIVDLINSYIPLKRAGTAFKANCPFHHEKTPSFTVRPTTQTFHCFGCGKHGSAIGFVMEYESLPFVEAVKKLAAKANVPIVETFDPQADADRRSKGRLLDLHREAAAFFHERLLSDPEAAHARAYMKSRDFGKAMAERWTVGWMPRDSRVFKEWVKSRKFTGQELVASGMAGLKDEENPRAGLYIRFTDRLMIPIRNDIGDVIGFSGRKLREDQQGGKYQNSPETVIFKKSNILFALDRAKKSILKERSALLCEGQLDTICCHEAGVTQAVGTQGTALTSQHAKILKRYASDVILCYDADPAGFAASEKAFQLLVAEGLNARVVEMPQGEDPDSYLKTYGDQAFRSLIANAKEFFDSKLIRAKAAGELDAAASRAKITNDCISALAAMNDHASRDHQINVVATHLGISPGALREGIARAKRFARKDTDPRKEEEIVVQPTSLHSVVAALCHCALSSGVAQHFLAEQFESLHEADRWVEGIPLLERILAAAPDPASTSARNAFLLGLPEADRLALSAEDARWKAEDDDGMLAAERALAVLSSLVLQKRDAALKAAMREPGLSKERMMELLEEVKEIASLMKGMPHRVEFDDQLAPSTTKPKVPAWKKKWEK